MQRALDLALNGLGNTSPNPMVGCVIIYNNKIIGEGYTSPYGGPHAEVNAINSVKDKSLLSESTLYVTLEPCAHFGKTPPCADLIMKHKISKVVICNLDPFDKVNGAGIQKLKEGNGEVITGVLEKKGRFLNRRFFTSIEKKRPYIILKWAQTKDGFVARKNFDSKWISNTTSRKLVHKLRTEEDSILVGFNTTKYDNPKLTARDWIGKNPIRIVVDKDLKLGRDIHLFDGSVPTICFNQVEEGKSENLEWVKVDFNRLEESILDALHIRNIQSVIVEGGSKTIEKFIANGLWDEARVFIGDQKFGSGLDAPVIRLEPTSVENIESDLLKIYYNV